MGYSSLCRNIVPAYTGNYRHDRLGKRICKFTPHHMAGILTGEQCAALFQNPNRVASANYCIGHDGGIVGNVDEAYRAYTSGNETNDCMAITVEVSNDVYGGNWSVSDKAYNSLVLLAVDVCRRYGFRLSYNGTPSGSLTTHNMFQATSCPGGYLESKMPELARVVNSILDGGSPSPAPVPSPIADQVLTIGSVAKFGGVFRVDYMDIGKNLLASSVLSNGTPNEWNWISATPLYKCNADGSGADINGIFHIGDFFCCPTEFTINYISKPNANEPNGVVGFVFNGRQVYALADRIEEVRNS